MSTHTTHHGHCFCGTVQLEVTGEPAAAGFCHCDSCRRWSAGPVNAFTLWKPEQVRVTHGEESLNTYNKTPASFRRWCIKCGGHVLTEHPTFGLVDVFAAVIPSFPFRPALHVHYQESVLPIHDGLPKLQDLPAEMGGSGTTLPE